MPKNSEYLLDNLINPGITLASKHRYPDLGGWRAVLRLGEARPAPTIVMFTCLRNIELIL